MANTAVKIAVIESELGWDRRIDDWMVCLTEEDAKAFQQEFNARNDFDGWRIFAFNSYRYTCDVCLIRE